MQSYSSIQEIPFPQGDISTCGTDDDDDDDYDDNDGDVRVEWHSISNDDYLPIKQYK